MVGVTTVEGEPGFILTVPGPGTVMRVLVQGLPIFFEAGAVTTVLLDVVTLGAGPGLRLAGGNVIAFNGGNGIRVEDEGSAGNTFRGNELRGNGALDVDLVAAADPASGLTPPDEGDADRGPNGLLNPPGVSVVRFDGGLARVEGRGPPGALIDLYAVEDSLEAVSAASAAGAGGALRYLGSAVVGGGGFRSDPLPLGTTTVLTALATDAAGNTSEFAVNVVVGLGPRVDRVRPGGGSTAGGNAVTIEGAGFGEASGFRAFFGGREATVVSVGAETAVVLTPANDEGAVAVSVRGGGRTDVPLARRVQVPPRAGGRAGAGLEQRDLVGRADADHDGAGADRGADRSGVPLERGASVLGQLPAGGAALPQHAGDAWRRGRRCGCS